MRRTIKVNYSPFTAEWNITGKKNIGYRDVNANTTYGTFPDQRLSDSGGQS